MFFFPDKCINQKKRACFVNHSLDTIKGIETCLLYSLANLFVLMCKVLQLLDYCELSNRFPRDQWDSALQFFLKKQQD